MAVYTKLSNAQISAFLSRFDAGMLVSAEGIAEGIENSNYLLVTSSGKYILTLYEQRVKPQELPFFMELTRWLAERGIACPRPIADRDGKVIHELAGKPAALIEFLEGKGNPNITNYHMEQLGALSARMHVAAHDFPLSRPNALSLAGWQELYAEIGSKADTIEAGLPALIEKELAYLAEHWPQDLPSGVVHADLFPDNVFFKQDQLSGAIDFYFACNDFWAYDLMITLNAWCFNGVHQFVPGRAKALVQAYHAVRPITQRERDNLQLLARGAAMRFLLTRCYDWLNRVEGALVTPKDPMEYVAKLRFHQNNNLLTPL